MRASSDLASRPSRRRLALLCVACIAALLSCARDVTEPNGSARLVHGLSWHSIFPPPLRQAGGVSSGIVDFNRVHVVLHHSDGTVALDSTIAFPAGADSLTVSLTVKLLDDAPSTGEPMDLDLAYVDAAGDTVFKGGPIALIAAPPPAAGGVNPPVQVPVVYTGPGAAATSVAIAPRSVTVAAAAPFTFTAVAKDAGGNVLAGTPVIWTSLDPTIATITAPAAGTGVALNVRGTARIMAQLLSGASDTVQVIVTLPASQLVKPASGSGDGQTAIAGTLLPLPLVAKVAASDGTGISGTTVNFAVASGGGLLTNVAVVTDGSGLAQTAWTLGAAAGVQTVTATAGTLTGSPLTYTATATISGPATHTWTGAASNLWTTAANWSPASVPGATDSVFIPAVTTPPTLTSSTTVGAIVIATGGPLTLAAGATLTVNGVFDATGGIVSAGTVVLAGAKTATGIVVGPLTVTGTYTLVNTLGVTGDLAITSGGITVNGGELGVSGNFSTSGTGTLTMNNGADVVSITGNATFAGGSTVGHLTDGLLAVSGNFTQSGASSTFAPSGNNEVAMVANAPQSVTVASPGTPVFQDFLSSNAQLVTITSPIVILGNATIGGPVTTGTNPLTIGGTLTDPGALLATPVLTLANTVFPVAPSTSAITSNVMFTGASAALQAPLEVFGSVTLSGGNLRLNGEQMAVTGAFVTTNGGTLTMDTPADSLLIGGEATFSGGPEAGQLTAGTLGLLQGLVVGGLGQFSASGSHVTLLAGPPPAGAACLCTTVPAASRSMAAAAPARGTAQLVAARRARAAAVAQTAQARRAALAAARAVLAAKWPSRALSVRKAAVAGPAAVRAARAAPVTISATARARISANRAPLPTLPALPSLRSLASPSLTSPRARSGISRAVIAAPRAAAAPPAGPVGGSSFTTPVGSDSAVYVAFGDTTGNHFASVRVSGSTNWQTAANIAGKMLVDSSGFVEGNGHLLLSDTLFVSTSGVVEPEALELLGALSDSGFFSPDTTLFSAVASQTMPSVHVGSCGGTVTCALDYGNVIVKSPALGLLAEDGNEVDVLGSLFIVNSGQLRLGVPDSVGCFGCLADEMFVFGAIETHGSGTLRMTDTNQPFLEVDDSAYFAGGSTAGLLTQGEVDYFGNFRQSGSLAAYAATSPHQAFFGSPSPQTITFANPSFANSHFGDLFLADTSTVINSSVFDDGIFETGGSVGTVVRAGVAGAGMTSKGAEVSLVDFDGVTWDLQDGYAVTSMNVVAFDNQSPTAVQFSIERGNSIPFSEALTTWSFSTRPTTGLYVQVTQTDGGVLGPLSVTFSGVALGGNFGFLGTIGGAIVTGWPLGGGGDAFSTWSSTDNLTGDPAHNSGTSPRGTGMLSEEWFRPVTPLRALRF